jgi:hypothetical protein
MTGSVSTAELMTVVPETLPPADYTPPPYPTPEPPTAIPPLPGGLSPTELKYTLLEQYLDFFFCDPDLYPVAIDDELQLALQRFPEIQANAEEFQAILNHNGLSGVTSFTDEQKMLIYREHKKLNALLFELAGDKYQFQFQTSDQNEQGFLIKGSIDAQGKIEIESRDAAIATCPICLAHGTRIDTPRGPVAVQDLKPGDWVWTLNADGERLPARLQQTGHVPVPPTHRLAHIVLDDGRQLWVSPGHPSADGRRLGRLRQGDLLDGARVLSAGLVSYSGGATYDILPAGDTGFYWANGILIASTLVR